MKRFIRVWKVYLLRFIKVWVLFFFFFYLTGVICLVVAVMYWLGWEMGAVEAISLSILVGSSVDYCLHLVEGYLLAGETFSLLPGQNSVRESMDEFLP